MLCFLDYYPLLPFDTQVCTVHLNPFDRIVHKTINSYFFRNGNDYVQIRSFKGNDHVKSLMLSIQT